MKKKFDLGGPVTAAPPMSEDERRKRMLMAQQQQPQQQTPQMGMKKGGPVESKAMVKKEVAFFKKKGAPKAMVQHEERELKGYKKGGMVQRGWGCARSK